MKTLREYVTETEHWADCPRVGDNLDIELAPDELIEGRVIESDGEHIVLQLSESAVDALQQRGLLSERIGRYGAVGSSRGMGYSLGEGDIDPNRHAQTRDYGRGEDDEEEDDDLPFRPDRKVSDRDQFGNPIKNVARHLARRGMRQAMSVKEETVEEDYMSRMLELAGMTQPVAETAPIQPNPNAARTDPLAAKAADLAPVGTEQDPTTATTVDEGVMSEIDLELQNIAASGDEEELIDALGGLKGNNVALYLEDMMSGIANELAAKGMDSIINDEDRMLDIMMDRIQSQYDDQDLDEAEYQGRKVELNKPMAGDVKKSKVYVKDPSTGNVKKVNFGDKTMRIKKSNPARRKSFRARHNCDNPGPKTKARYWSCRAW
jgi:hypothetical protein